jgi:phosphoribosylformimino-5-aminoimidazole carboxamide ribotide isomerase
MVMRVIPVIDLKSGAAVHAVRGQRQRYRPLRSGLVAGSDPLHVARAFRGELGLGELYVADLDAIAGGPPHRDALAVLARGARMMVDAGVTDVRAVRPLLELGAARVVIGTETLAEPAALARLRAELPGDPLVLSLDLRGERVLSRDAGLGRLGAAEALALLGQSGVREVIVLDLARVGTGAGPDVALVRELCARFPDVDLLAGGGVRDLADLRALAEAGAAGALVATALHHGAIGPGDLRALDRGGGQPTTVSRCSASAAATSTPVARSTPCQPGMPLTSST